ncbi:MAG: exodeoxyribonuclease III [Bacteroidales bacterium]
MKLISWNVNGLRAVAKKGFFDSLEEMQPDVICLQETKAQDHQVTEVLDGWRDHLHYSHSAERPGYSGTAILTRTAPLSVSRGLVRDGHDHEGRVLHAEFPGFHLVNAYVPNSGNDLKRLAYRQQWDTDFFDYLKELERDKPVVACGDFNVAHTDLDLARPKPNYNKSAGYMQEEIDAMDRFTRSGFIDTFRHRHPGVGDQYSWWTYRAGAREKNVGWRIDYVLVSEALVPILEDAFILPHVHGSDHCPVGVELGTAAG